MKNPSTGVTRELVRCVKPCVFIDGATWSPDGTRIGYNVVTCVAAAPCERQAGLWIKQAGHKPRQLTSSCDGGSNCVGEDWGWSSDGRVIALVRSTRHHSQLSMIDPGSGEITPVVSTESAIYALQWSPTGLRIAFADGDGVSLVSPTGGRRRSACGGQERRIRL